MLLKWPPFEYKSKFEKNTSWSEIGIFLTYFLKNCTKKVLKIYRSIKIENFETVAPCPIKWQPFQVFREITRKTFFNT